MKYLSVCSGIEAATQAWHPLGWQPVAFAEVEAFPCAVLAHHYPSVPNWGDMTRFQEWPDAAAVDVLVGGTPCQSFSVAGLRQGLADPRGNLALTYLALAHRYRPRWVVWENVPGVLSATAHDAPDPPAPPDHLDEGAEWVGEDQYDADENHAFSCFLAGLSELGYGFAYRCLDAQYFGLAQRRQRVFVVGHLGDWHRAAAVLFESASLSGHPAPRREAGQRTTHDLAPCVDASGCGFSRTGDKRGQDPVVAVAHALPAVAFGGNTTTGPIDVATAVRATGGTGHGDFESETFLAHALRADGFDASEDGTGRGTPLVVAPEPYTLAIRGRGESCDLEYRQDGVANAVLTPNGGRAGIGVGAIAFSAKDYGADVGDLAPTLRAGGHTTSHANGGVMPAVVVGAVGFYSNQGSHGGGANLDVAPTLKAAAKRSNLSAVAFDARQSDVIQYGDQSGPLDTDGHTIGVLAFRDVAGAITSNYGKQPDNSDTGLGPNLVGSAMQVRRLTPRECERLQGFPDDYTLVPYRGKPAADGPRYKALGNSMAVPVMAWIGRRLAQVDQL